MHNFSNNNNDLDLAAACSQGDQRAQRILFERVKSPMFGVCLRFCESRAAAEDLLQEGFIRVFKDIGKYRGEGSLDGWVRRVFVRTCIEHIHKQKKIPETVALEHLENIVADVSEDFDPYHPESAINMLRKLPAGFRAVLNLAILEEMSHEEIARELGITASTSRSQLARAKVFLRKIIAKTLILV